MLAFAAFMMGLSMIDFDFHTPLRRALMGRIFAIIFALSLSGAPLSFAFLKMAFRSR